jgi:nucleoside-diphosphate-sugar epimerase
MADLASARRVVSAARPDIVFHLAGTVSASPSLELVLPTYQSLLTSTVNVLLAAREFGCRVVLTGSFTSPMPGAIEPVPRSPYGAAKWAAVGYGRMFQSLYGTPVVILNPFMTYGPGQAMSKVIPSVTLALLRGESPKLTSGNVRFDWVYIADVIEGFVAAAIAPGIDGMTIDLGSGRLLSLRDVSRRLGDIVGNKIEPVFGALPDRPSENEIAANTATAWERLGWRATTSIDDGLRQTVEWYRASVGPGASNATRDSI